MRIYIFKSETRKELRAFAGDWFECATASSATTSWSWQLMDYRCGTEWPTFRFAQRSQAFALALLAVMFQERARNVDRNFRVIGAVRAHEMVPS